MKMTTINETALAAAMDYVLGQDARVEVENLYAVIDKAHADGFVAGRSSIDIEAVRKEGFQNGYNVGYEDGKAVATGTEQPWEFDGAPMLLPYYGDSGDEMQSEYDYEDDINGFYAADTVDDDFDDALPPMQEQRKAVTPGVTQFRRGE